MRTHAALSLLRLVLAALVRPVAVLLVAGVILFVVGSTTRGTVEFAAVLWMFVVVGVLAWDAGRDYERREVGR